MQWNENEQEDITYYAHAQILLRLQIIPNAPHAVVIENHDGVKRALLELVC